MRTTDRVNHFTEKYFNPLLFEKLLQLKEYYIANKAGLIKEFQERLLDLLNQPQADFSIIVYQLLRSSLFLDKKGEYLIGLPADASAGNNPDSSITYNAHWAFKGLLELEDELEQSRKLYAGKVLKLHVKELILKEIPQFAYYVLLLARQAVINIEIEKLRNSISKTSMILLGDYITSKDLRNTSLSIVYQKPDAVPDELLKKEQSGPQCFFLDGLDFNQGKYLEHNLSFSRLENCNGAKSIFNASDFSGSRISNSDFSKSNFFMANITGADFSESDLRGAAFDFSKAYDEAYSPLIGHAVFEGADLRQAYFKDADLRYADFCYAKFEDTSFIGANLENARFLQKDAELLRLTPEQIEAVNWI